ncbi:MAG: aspartate aminotransferase family protein [Deltaproteobacteria bacterium]|nr:aspartate aminotransferase family protein [Deltaproteobacteria bacterium]
MEKADRVIAATYGRFPVVLTEGRGCSVRDTEGRTYRDFVAGIAVCNLGHAHPGVAEAVSRQARRLVHVSNLYYTEPQVELAEWLVAHSFAERVFFANSGAEANEAAIKLARKYAKEAGSAERYRIITMEGSFHGRTMATLSATGQDKIKKGFDPLLAGFDIVAFNDLDAVRAAVTEKTCAVLLEPIQGEGGVRCATRAYLEGLRALCDQEGLLLIFDEVQTGMGRTGRLFAYEHFEVAPDIMTLAKALANGLPMGAMLATNRVAQAFGPGSHASTFGGTPLVAAAALEVVKALVGGGIVDHGRKMGRYFMDRLRDLQLRHDMIREVRGQGLLIGLDLRCDGASVVKGCMDQGFLINCTQGHVLRFMPPLIVEKDDIDALVSCLERLFSELSPG